MSAARGDQLLSLDQRAPARMRVPQLAAEITRNKKLDRVSHVHARPPLAPPLRRGSLRRECGTQLKLLGFSSPRGESKFSFNVSKKKKRELELELESMVRSEIGCGFFANLVKFLQFNQLSKIGRFRFDPCLEAIRALSKYRYSIHPCIFLRF